MGNKHTFQILLKESHTCIVVNIIDEVAVDGDQYTRAAIDNQNICPDLVLLHRYKGVSFNPASPPF